KYANVIEELDFEAPRTVKDGGTANYVYEIVTADNARFKARAEAITDFDGDGVLNIWEIDENGNPRQIMKD
ncbi:general secretion pathway protein GspG, partial [Muricauda sp. JGD-17]|nr:general secretion pathway protein GspG [Allomuricauda ochracea]